MFDRMDEIIKDLQNPNYWDLLIIGNHRTLQLRQQWDRETCILIRDRIIESLKQLEEYRKLEQDCQCKNIKELDMHITALADGQAMLQMNLEQKDIVLDKIDKETDLLIKRLKEEKVWDPRVMNIKQIITKYREANKK